MADKGKKQDEDHGLKMSTSTADSELVNVRDIPRMNPEDLDGEDNPSVKHLLERDSSNRAFIQANRRQLKLITDAITGQGKLVNLIWSEHCELNKAFQEEKELTRKGILYSIERSGGYALPDSQPTIREELLRSFGTKRKEPEGSASEAAVKARVQATGQLKRRLYFDNMGEADKETDGASAVIGGPEKNDEEARIKFGCIGSAHFPREILFQRDALSLDRKTLWSLRPKKAVPREVLDAVATMMTDESSDSIWWLPTSFVPVALNPTGYCKATLDFITRRYMVMWMKPTRY
ncbi:hypothetical protein PIB30_041551 [Stylosanthes scabra]|uniref:Uncharacterized protein n=1 Tax=Stylosanthes scabra TaxID=79078 RepID=A0ABU6ZDR0_9FABA|nr:hypothetical protein [Stylosanthes scabra]